MNIDNLEYLIILIVLLLLALIFENKFHVHLYHNRKERILTTLFFFIFGVAWDTFAIWRGHWLFPPGKTLGIKIGLMPIEEYLFILIIPFIILTTYKVMDGEFLKKTSGRKR